MVVSCSKIKVYCIQNIGASLGPNPCAPPFKQPAFAEPKLAESTNIERRDRRKPQQKPHNQIFWSVKTIVTPKDDTLSTRRSDMQLFARNTVSGCVANKNKKKDTNRVLPINKSCYACSRAGTAGKIHEAMPPGSFSKAAYSCRGS